LSDDTGQQPEESQAGELAETTLESASLYQGKILSLRRDRVRLPSGRLTIREVVEHSDSVCMVPLDEAGNVVLVRQYRTPTESALLEVPAGGIEDGEESEQAVLRELQEEIGYTAGSLRLLSGFWLAPGWCDEFMYAYLATDLIPSRMDPDDDEIIETVRVPLNETLGLIEQGAIQDAKSIASLLLAMQVVSSAGFVR
jgi:ADP-ribose pyrophosphatase